MLFVRNPTHNQLYHYARVLKSCLKIWFPVLDDFLLETIEFFILAGLNNEYKEYHACTGCKKLFQVTNSVCWIAKDNKCNKCAMDSVHRNINMCLKGAFNW